MLLAAMDDSRMRRPSTIFALIAAALLAALPAAAENGANERAIRSAERAIASGAVDPDRDLAPLVAALTAPQSPEDRRRVVSKIEDFGAADGDSPAAVKRYLVENATPVLVKIVRDSKDTFLRGDAITALRSLRPPRVVLEEVATMAEKDSDPYVQSRGEILRNYMKSLPAESAVASIEPKDEAKERKGIDYLKTRKLGVSPDQLRRSSLEGNYDEVRALLDAGVDVNAGSSSDCAIFAAVFSGCGSASGENERLVKTVDLLLAAGADVKRKDDNKNTILMSAAQMCGPKIVSRIIAAGADVNVVNGSGVSPLGMAIIMKKLDSADVLVDKGARLDARQSQMLAGVATDARSKAIVARASSAAASPPVSHGPTTSQTRNSPP